MGLATTRDLPDSGGAFLDKTLQGSHSERTSTTLTRAYDEAGTIREETGLASWDQRIRSRVWSLRERATMSESLDMVRQAELLDTHKDPRFG
jgi:hypothetical protein